MTVSPSGALLERLFGGEETSPRPLSISTCVPELDRLSRILGETKCYMIASAETCRSVATSIKIKRPHTQAIPSRSWMPKGESPPRYI
jgi:hypothetical protein